MLVDWFRDGAPLESSEVVRITRIDPVTSVLAISSLTAAMAGNYTCVAKNEVAMVEEMCSPGYEPHCDANYAYRTISGQCNNLE